MKERSLLEISKDSLVRRTKKLEEEAAEAEEKAEAKVMGYKKAEAKAAEEEANAKKAVEMAWGLVETSIEAEEKAAKEEFVKSQITESNEPEECLTCSA